MVSYFSGMDRIAEDGKNYIYIEDKCDDVQYQGDAVDRVGFFYAESSLLAPHVKHATPFRK